MDSEIRSPMVQRAFAILFSDPMIIGGLTVLGYLMAFSFVTGAADALGIPSELISVSLENVLTALTALLAFIGLSSLALDMVMTSAPQRIFDNALFRQILPIVALAVISALGGLLLSRSIYVLEAFPVLFLSGLLIPPLSNNVSGGTYLERLRKNAEAGEELRRNSQRRTWLLKRIGVGPVWLVGTVMALIVVSAVIGRVGAWSRTHYFVSLTEPREVLLARYGDVLVFRRGDSPAVVIRVIGKDGIPELIWARTGSMGIAQSHN